MRSDRFICFGSDHVSALVLTLLAALAPAALCSWAKRTERAARYVLAALIFAGQAASVVVALMSGTFRDELPLQLCDVAAFAAVWALIGRARFAYELTYFLGLAGTTQALITPDLAVGFPEPAFILFFFTHGSVIVAALYLTLAVRQRPN